MKLIFERQSIHALAVAVLFAGLYLAGKLDGMQTGSFFGIDTHAWFWLAACLAVAHQVFVWLSWRIQLNGQIVDKLFGKLSFPIYATCFFALGASRVSAVFALAVSNSNTLPLNTTVLRITAIVALVPALYLLYSVGRYFSFRRAFGIDHFDERYRSMPLERRGIFRFTRNGMYIFGFLFLWIPALWFASIAAIFIALFNHLYIWVHYYTTELPDMKRIYGQAA